MNLSRAGKMVVCLCAALVAAAVVGVAGASAATPGWYECAKVAGGKFEKGCSKEGGTGGYEVRPGVGKAKAFKGKIKAAKKGAAAATLDVKTWEGDNTVECTAGTSSATPETPNLETDISVTYTGCAALKLKKCQTAGASEGEVKITGLDGELGYLEEGKVGLRLYSAANPGYTGEIAHLECGSNLSVTVTGGVIGEVTGNVNVFDKSSDLIDEDGPYIGTHTFEGKEYVPLVNQPAFADEQAAFEAELAEDLEGKLPKLERPIFKTIICGELIEELLGVECTPETYTGLKSKDAEKGEDLMIAPSA